MSMLSVLRDEIVLADISRNDNSPVVWKGIAEDGLRKAKLKVLAFVQVYFFRHLQIVSAANVDQSQTIAQIILGMCKASLRDHVLEVRQLASLTLSGLVRCSEDMSSSSIGPLLVG